jgi:hypothetical protein
MDTIVHSMFRVSQLFIYPIKSLKGISVPAIKLTPTGFEMDRLMMLVDAQGRFVSQREFPALCKFEVHLNIKKQSLLVKHREHEIHVPLRPSTNSIKAAVTVWEDTVEAVVADSFINQWFTNQLATEVRLVYMPNANSRKAILPNTQKEVPVSFADTFPILLVGEASLKLLQSKINMQIEMERFRPNLTFTGGEPHAEDLWKSMVINKLEFAIVKPCARCNVVTLNPLSGIHTEEPLKTLALYRKVGNKVLFGQNIIAKEMGYIQVGDSIQPI